MIDTALAFRYLTGALDGGDRPAAVGRKFDSAGRVLPFAGNTTLCHLDPASPVFRAVSAAQARLRGGPLADAYTFMPPASFHMTVFEGITDQSRTADRWPGHLPLNAPVEQVTQDFAGNLKRLGLPRGFRVRPEGIFGGFCVSLTGADAAAEGDLRKARDRLQQATNLIRPDHAQYRFHITLAYLLRWLSPDEARQVVALSQDVGAELRDEIATIPLGPVEFCRFQDMYHFERLAFLS